MSSKTPRIPGAVDPKEEIVPDKPADESKPVDPKEEIVPDKPADESKPCLTKGGWVVPTTKKG